jgi:hypothetical protein
LSSPQWPHGLWFPANFISSGHSGLFLVQQYLAKRGVVVDEAHSDNYMYHRRCNTETLHFSHTYYIYLFFVIFITSSCYIRTPRSKADLHDGNCMLTLRQETVLHVLLRSGFSDTLPTSSLCAPYSLILYHLLNMVRLIVKEFLSFQMFFVTGMKAHKPLLSLAGKAQHMSTNRQ